ncbi:MAG: phosphate regulon sensor histidine kinase PhoR [Oceanospirillaceae bacterium]|nr:phosphate regulon sensor histidine kinase PhoR [Oceanospirillaceae bacterium]|tara:strand:- start:396 stop:1676 length:1281 start_codon:yes stop_codon:yes gene_type:complete
MIRPDRHRERLVTLLLIVAGVSGVWWLPQFPFLPLAVVTSGISARTMIQTYRLRHWMVHQDPTQPLPGSGLWGDIYYQIQRLSQRSQRSQRRLQVMLDRIQDSTAALQDGVIMVDRHGNIEWWNRAAGQYLGLRAPADVNHPLTNLIRAPEFITYFERCEYDEPLVMQAQARNDLYLQFSITLFGRNDRLIVVHDVTRLRLLEQMRKDFVANVSHELRTPLTVINGYLETFGELSDDLPVAGQKMLARMQEQGQRMEAIIRDLLVLSRLETGSSQGRDDINVPAMLRLILEEARALSGGRHDLQLEVDVQNHLPGYEHELRSAFTNLVVNAVKYTQEGGRIKARWYRDGDALCLSVTDNGIGIDERHIPRLTERFYRADPSRSKDTGGTGLGLAIVKHVLLRHDAELQVESRIGQGSTFTARFSRG